MMKETFKRLEETKENMTLCVNDELNSINFDKLVKIPVEAEIALKLLIKNRLERVYITGCLDTVHIMCKARKKLERRK